MKKRTPALLLVGFLVSALSWPACGGGTTSPDVEAPAPTPETTPLPLVTTAYGLTIPLVGGQASTLDALWFSRGLSGAVGGSTRTTVTVEPNPNRDLNMFFGESEVLGLGATWRASAWMAAVVSSLLLGVDISDYRFTYGAGGRIDGPSAGGLLTMATLAGLLGKGIDPQMTMTGSINPDGTIGPVGGVIQKLDGAKAAGKTTVLVPAAQEQSVDLQLFQELLDQGLDREEAWEDALKDVREEGTKRGLEVKLVEDIYGVYREFTGSGLPRPAGLQEEAPTLEGASFSNTEAATNRWLVRVEQLTDDFQRLDPTTLKVYGELMDGPQEGVQLAKDYLDQGDPATAHAYAIDAAVDAAIALQSATVSDAYIKQDIPGVVSHLRSMLPVGEQVQGFLNTLRSQKPNTTSDVVVLADSYASTLAAMGMVRLAEERLAVLAEAASGNGRGKAGTMRPIFRTEEQAESLYIAAAERYGEAGLKFRSLEPYLQAVLQEAEGQDIEKMTNLLQYVESGADNGFRLLDDARFLMEEADSQGSMVSEARGKAIAAKSVALLAAADMLAAMADAYQVVGPKMLREGIDEEVAQLLQRADQLREEAQEALSDTANLPSPQGQATSAIETPSAAAPVLVSPGATSDTTAGPTTADSLTRQETMEELEVVSIYLALADLLLLDAQDSMDLRWGQGTAQVPPIELVESVAEMLRRSSEAALLYFEELEVAPLGEHLGISMSRARQRFMEDDLQYAMVIAARSAMRSHQGEMDGRLERAYASLGLANLVYTLGSTFIARYYSLGEEETEDGESEGAHRKGTLNMMLNLAEQRTRELIALARSQGADPLLPILHYTQGRVRSLGDEEAQIQALSYYWQASHEAQLMAFLSASPP